MVLPATQKAIVIQGPGVAKVVTDRPIPELRHDYILVKTAAVGLTSRGDVKDTFSLAYTAIGEGFTGGHLSVPASEEDFLFGVEFWDLSRELLESGKIKASPVQVGQGLEGVLDGLQALKENQVSGKKLVYKL